ncbi:DUF3037 domain-containing protein [Avibacterium paragallinarum]|uniref:DUF3037 domain-containing protein n=1 Tax=Avibacterium paragallinarum TaxID=728 RepID=UPI002EDA4621
MIRYNYSIIKLIADSVRNEIINVGVAVFHQNYTEVFVLQERDKLRCVSNSIHLEDIKKFAFNLSEFSTKMNKEDLLFFFSRGSIYLSGEGYFQVEYADQYKSKVAALMSRLVNMPVIQKQSKPRNSKVITRLKDVFKQENLISTNLSDIDHHKLVLNYPIDAEKGLKADMLLKNSVYHLTETIEFSQENLTKNLERAALKAVTISEAKNVFGNDLYSFIVYSLSYKDEQKNSAQIKLLSDYSTNLINLQDPISVSNYKDHIINAIS